MPGSDLKDFVLVRCRFRLSRAMTIIGKKDSVTLGYGIASVLLSPNDLMTCTETSQSVISKLTDLQDFFLLTYLLIWESK